MSEVKMRENFHRNGINSFCGDISENGVNIFTGGCKYKADAIVFAVNSHDKLTEQNKLLREALEEIGSGIDVSNRIIGITCHALEQAK